ncbi:hypothetical protein RFN58_29605 [Streptomyces iakyrus]|uniref:hypothetical protein n=1 Tax=Streptomyces iakyrus TaxID=68219 RepID=UPI00068AA208|nr:hypothetical protein [Streptomyces iakyrus]
MAPEFFNPNEDKPGGGPSGTGTPAGGPAGPQPAEAAQPAEPEQPGTRWSPRVVPPQAPGRTDAGPAPAYPSQPTLPPPMPPVQDGNLEPLRIPTAPQEDGTAADRVRIGLWGAPRSGKTTYLAALPIAAMQYQRHGQGNWLISGMTAEANTFLSDSVSKLAIQREFPGSTVAVTGMSWSFQGQEPGTGMMRRRTREPSFVLEIQDAPGEAFRPSNPLQTQVVDQLARSQGLIYLFDPLGDAQELTQSLTFFYSTLNELNTRIRDAGGHYRGRLPHHVSVCVAKFDHPDVFRPAVEAGWVTQDTVGSQLPRIPEHLSERYFQWLCDEFRGSTARLVRDGLANFFHPDRITYYATSAIGFRLNPQHVFDYRNYANEEIVDGVRRICTSPEPINVLEPLTDLERKIRTVRDARKGWRR